jgi:flavin reductase (DIM6/NTAB) family NADH-FMN oxidoreductase RutF
MMPAGWHTILSRNPFLIGVSISPLRFTHKMLTDFPYATINLIDEHFQKLVEDTGKCSGKNVDKFGKLGVEKSLAENGSAYIKGIPAYFEVERTDYVETGDHTLFVLRVTKTVLERPFTPLFQIEGSRYQPFLTE